MFKKIFFFVDIKSLLLNAVRSKPLQYDWVVKKML
jgi:hypothetical protein